MTIEFRRGPGVTMTEDCLAWVELAVSFARSARALVKAQQLQNYTRDVQGLKQFINATLEPSMSQPVLMAPIFAGKQGFCTPRAMPTLTAELRDKLKNARDRERNEKYHGKEDSKELRAEVLGRRI